MPAPVPFIMSYEEFLKATTPANPFYRGRDQALHLVDIALKGFQSERYSPNIDDKQATALHLCDSCQQWLKTKQEKQTDQCAMRRAIVEQLGRQGWNYFQYWTLAERKEISKLTGKDPQLKPLGGGYAAERQQYERNKTHNPISGSWMHEAIGSALKNEPIGRDETTQKEQIGAYLGTRKFEDLTDADFNALNRIFILNSSGQRIVDPASMDKTKLERAVLYLDKEERIKHVLLVKGGLLMEDFNKPLSTGNSIYPYARDKYGHLLTMCLQTGDKLAKCGFFNHSSFNAGKDVVCAGVLEAEAGRLTSFGNESGHYKPTRENLHNGVALLAQQKIDFRTTKIKCLEFPGGKQTMSTWNSGTRFLANMNSAPDKTES